MPTFRWSYGPEIERLPASRMDLYGFLYRSKFGGDRGGESESGGPSEAEGDVGSPDRATRAKKDVRAGQGGGRGAQGKAGREAKQEEEVSGADPDGTNEARGSNNESDQTGCSQN